MKTASHLLLFICLNILIGQVDYQTQIQTIFNSNCTSCHVNGGSYFGGLDLSTYANVMNGGNSGVVVIPNDHVNSYLWQRVNNGEMPPEANPDLSASQVDLIALWINEGALENPDNFPPSDFSLLTPENGDTVHINSSNQNDSLLFQWEESIDPDGDSIQYIFGIFTVGGFGVPTFTLMYEDTLEQTHLSLSNTFIADSIAEIEEPDDTNDLIWCGWYVNAFDGLELNEQGHELAFDFSGYLVDWDFSLSEPVIEVMGTDNVWNPGDTISVEMDFCNNTDVAHNYYPGVTIESDSSLTSLHSGHIWFYAMVADECHAISWGAIADTSIISDTIVTFRAYPEALNCQNQPEYCIDGDTLTFEVPIVVQVISADPEPFTPEEFSLHQNYPNPFNPVTTLRYDLPENGYVNITIYDMLGREVKTLINQTQDAGYRSVICGMLLMITVNQLVPVFTYTGYRLGNILALRR